MRKSQKKVLSLLTVVAMVAGLVAPLMSGSKAMAANIPDVTVTLDVETAGGSNTDVYIMFSTPTDLTAQSLIDITLDANFTETANIVTADIAASCDADMTPGGGVAMSNVVVTDTTQDIISLDLDTDTCANYFSLRINGGSNNLDNPATAGNYNVSVTTDVGDAGTSFDTGAGLAYIADENDVVVTATVPPIIDMELYDNETDGALQPGNPNTCYLGSLSPTLVSPCDYWIGTSANSAGGIQVKVADSGTNDGLNKGDSGTNDDLINNVTATQTIDAGTEEYGFSLTDTGSYTADGSYSTNYSPVPTTESNVFYRTGVHTSIGTNNPGERVQVTHAASIDGSTEAGSYQNDLTYTAYSRT